ncbi:MAG TPA: FIST N-terminal domain-containing protein [Pyrinomonadaceae bacterium]|nr:FIST N-terminal domain-containing protein [Pyrinomonadaceae bacterium]
MKIETYSYSEKNSWSDPFSAELDSPETLVVVFGASSFLDKPQILSELTESFPKSKIIGCSTSGEILGETINDESLSVAVAKFEKTCLDLATAPISKAEESFAAGEKLAKTLLKPSLRGVLVLSDGLNVNGSELVKGLNSVLPTDVVVTGGLAGDGDRFARTWVLKDGNPQSNFISAVGFYGDSVKIGHGSKGGWDIFGPERKITKANSNQLFELDGKPALQLYKNYLGDLVAELPASALLFPLSLRNNMFEEKRIVRTILSVDENSQSMTFAGDVPEGALVQLMRANFDRLIDGASEAALMTNGKGAESSAENVLSIAISCVGRRLILGERAEEELEAVLDELPSNTKQVGFYSYGEISPYATGHCDLHNQTMTLTTISEE